MKGLRGRSRSSESFAKRVSLTYVSTIRAVWNMLILRMFPQICQDNSRPHESFLYLSWGENENEGMKQSSAAMQKLLPEVAPARLRRHIERARGADHQTTPTVALPSALEKLYAVLPRP